MRHWARRVWWKHLNIHFDFMETPENKQSELCSCWRCVSAWIKGAGHTNTVITVGSYFLHQLFYCFDLNWDQRVRIDCGKWLKYVKFTIDAPESSSALLFIIVTGWTLQPFIKSCRKTGTLWMSVIKLSLLFSPARQKKTIVHENHISREIWKYRNLTECWWKESV